MVPTAGQSTGTGITAPWLHELCTVYFALLVSVVDPVVTVTFPLVAPVGTVAVIYVVPESVVLVACTPLNFTTEEDENPCPKMPTCDATLPEVLDNRMNGFAPMFSVNTVPQPPTPTRPGALSTV